MKTDTKTTSGMDTKMIALTRPRRGMTLLTAAMFGLALGAAASPAFAQSAVAQTPVGPATVEHGENGAHFLIGHSFAGGGQATVTAGGHGGGQQGAVVAPAAPSAPRSAQGVSNIFFGQDRDDVAYYKERIALLEKYLGDARKKRDAAKEDAEKKRLDEYIARYESDLERSRQSLKTAERRAPLYKLVDVKFENASVKDAARALSSASGVPISVEDSVPETTRLTVEARRVRLVTVLESMAEQANVIIEPDEKGDKLGLRLVSPPMLKVNEKETKFIRQNSPWSAKWGTPPTRRFFMYEPLSSADMAKSYAELAGNYRALIPPVPPVAPAIRAADIEKTVKDALAKAARAQSLAPGATNRSTAVVRSADGKAVTISVSSDTVIISESGKNDKGETGIWMTIYKFDKDKKEMVKSSSTFHKTGEKP